MLKIVILGKRGSFHEEAAKAYFNSEVEITASQSFIELADLLEKDNEINFGVMAIENSIAGTILQNYRLLRERSFGIIAEKYIQIKHNLIGIQNVDLNSIQEINSHPMAIYQCRKYFSAYPDIKYTESSSTVAAVKKVSELQDKRIVAIGSKLAAHLYGMKIIQSDITEDNTNFTRFFIIQKNQNYNVNQKHNKASIYLRTEHKKGSLLKVLKKINDQNINLSKLQSYPVPGQINKYLFHLDLEFDSAHQFENVLIDLKSITQELIVLGVYERDM